MHLKVCVEEGESTLHKLQRALSSRGAGLQCTVYSSPGDNGSERGKKTNGGLRGWRKTHGQWQASWPTRGWGHAAWRRRPQGRRGRTVILYAIFSSWLLFLKACHICQWSSPDSSWCTPAHVVFIGDVFDIIQRAALPVWFLTLSEL